MEELKKVKRDIRLPWIQTEKEIFQKYGIKQEEMETKEIKDRKKYLKKLELQLNDYDVKIANLKSRAFTYRPESKENYQELLKKLNTQRETDQRKLRQIKNLFKNN